MDKATRDRFKRLETAHVAALERITRLETVLIEMYETYRKELASVPDIRQTLPIDLRLLTPDKSITLST